jgi:hypothetical protein
LEQFTEHFSGKINHQDTKARRKKIDLAIVSALIYKMYSDEERDEICKKLDSLKEPIAPKPTGRWPHWLNAIYPYLAAVWVGGLVGIFAGTLTEWPAVWPLVAATLTCFICRRAKIDRQPPAIQSPAALTVLWLITFSLCWWLFIGQQEKLQEKSERYDQIMDNWKLGLHKEAIDDIDNFAIVDRFKK